MATGQTLQDRLLAARHTLSGQGLARVVCKATTEEISGPKKKHLDYLLHCTNEPNVSIPQLANLLIDRTQQASWVVVFKALVTVHHLMCYGNERFTQYFATSNCTFQLSNFTDKTGVQGYDMSTFIRRYAKYLNEKALSYRVAAFDFCKIKRGKEDGTLRTMNTDKLLKMLPVVQNQLDALLEFDCSANDLTNGVVNSAFMLLFRDIIRLFACYNDGIINLLEKYFDMNKKQCREALDLYKKFLIRMDRVAEFLKVAESVGIDKGDIPDLTKAPSTLLDALEQHLAQLEGRKFTATSASANTANNLKEVVFALSSTSAAFGNSNQNQDFNGYKPDETFQIALEEEAVALDLHKSETDSAVPWDPPEWDIMERRLREIGGDPHSNSISAKTNPFLVSPASEQVTSPPQSNVDLFAINATASANPSDDLLCLAGNPFADSLFGNAAPTSNAFSQPQTNNEPFASEDSFASAFGISAAPTTGFDAFGDILQPQVSTNNAKQNDIAAPKSAGNNALIKGDLDSSLASLADNLNINGPAQNLKRMSGHQWGSPRTNMKTGGANYAPGVQPGAPMAWNSPQHFPPGGMGGMRPMAPAGMGPAMGMAMPQGAAVPQQPMGVFAGMQQQRGQFPAGQQVSSGVNDPFGAL